jgi:predicted TPR repeat methyltransferase
VSALDLPEPWACRSCGTALVRTFVDLGSSPPCEAFLTPAQLVQPETTYPLRVYTCSSCLLVQLPAHVDARDVFDDYAYFSSFSDSWVEHARVFVDAAVDRLGLGPDSLVVEVASNDGYLLQHVLAAGVRALGVEAADNVAQAARDRGVPTVTCYLDAASGDRLAGEHGRADLVVGNNVLAHVPDLRGFVAGLRALVSDAGWVSLEFPHLLRLVEQRQYDTIYHEHYSYFSLRTAGAALAQGGLTVVDVEELPTHGGSLRVWARPTEAADEPGPRVGRVLDEEAAAGLHTLDGHDGFEPAVFDVKQGLLRFLLDARRDGRTVAGYGAPGKGNTLLNHCGVRADLLPYTVDRNPYKHGRFLPGSHIPVLPPEELARRRPDYVLLLPWNLREELHHQLRYVREWGGRLVVPVPRLEVLP